MTINDLQGFLKQADLTPSRKLGQSFLIDSNVSRWIVSQLAISEGDTVIEIGPGFGALTEHLVEVADRLILIETDRRLVDFLRERFGPRGVEVIHADATGFDVRPLFLEHSVKLIGNLPYSCGNEILRRFLDAPSPVTEAVVMVQKEVADRFVAAPREKAYGVLGLMLQRAWQPTLLRTVGPSLFYPRPEVDSTIVRFNPRPFENLPPHSPEVFEATVKQGFSQRRKQLHNNLQIGSKRWVEICENLGWEASIRAEEVSLKEWAELSNLLDPHPCADLPPSATEELDVVDENDVVIEQRRRSEIHREDLLHRAVHVFLMNRKGEIYLQKRSPLKDTHGWKWDSSAAGHVDPGESYHDSAIREIWEEVWVRPRGEVKRVVRLEASERTDLEFIELFLAEPKGKIRVHGKEVDSGRYFSPQQIDDWVRQHPKDFATGFVTCWQESRHFFCRELD